MERVRVQLSLLWSPTCLKLLTGPLLSTVEALPAIPPPPPVPAEELLPPESLSSSSEGGARQYLKKAFEKTKRGVGAAAGGLSYSGGSSVPKGGYTKLGSPECMRVALICTLYQAALKTLSQLRIEILAGEHFGFVTLVWRVREKFV